MQRALFRCSVLAFALTVATALTVASVPRPASADATQLCRAFTTTLLAPTDVVFAPYIAANTMYWGITDQDDDVYKKLAFTLPGYPFLLFMQAGGAILRVAAGMLEFVPGLFTLFQDTSPDPLFTSQDESQALYSDDWGPCPIRIGVEYNTINQ